MINTVLLITALSLLLGGGDANTKQFVGEYRPGVSKGNSLNVADKQGLLSNNTQRGFNVEASQLVFEDNFDTLDFKTWRHEITLGGGANWEFEQYSNNRSVSYVRDGILYINPGFTSDLIGNEQQVLNGGSIDIWGNMPNNECTSNAYYGCARSSNGQNILNPIQSAQLRSYKKLNIKYGKVDVRARLPKGDWIWPAIWFLPTDHAYGSWPASGEIDLIEGRGNGLNYPAGGHGTVASTLHWGPDFFSNRYQQTTASYTLPNQQSFSDDFHVFTLEWSANAIVTKVDGIPILTVPISNSFWNQGKFNNKLANPWKNSDNSAPFNQEFNLIFNVAVGGTNGYFPEGMGNKPWSNQSPTAAKDFWLAKSQWLPTWPTDEKRALAIDYVRVWN